MSPPLVEAELTSDVLGAFFEVYNTLGFGFLESIYLKALQEELAARGRLVEREVGVAVLYKGSRVGCQRLDLLVERRLIVEVKSTAELPPAARRQLLNYLRAMDLKVGLLLHFGLKAEFHRMINLPRGSRHPSDPSHPADP